MSSAKRVFLWAFLATLLLDQATKNDWLVATAFGPASVMRSLPSLALSSRPTGARCGRRWTTLGSRSRSE